MRRATIGIGLSVLCWGLHSFTSQVRADQPGAGQPDAAQPAAVTAPADPVDAPAEKSAGQPNGPDAWRFKWHQNTWWYWLPSEKWVYWTGDQWAPYTPAAFQQFQASRLQTTNMRTTQPRRAYSYSQRESGNWGPVRYDGYGNRQYPYSRRSSGIKQLGPVPAMGGVRAMPGWGGER